MTDLDELARSVDAMTDQFAAVETMLEAVSKRLGRVIWASVAGGGLLVASVALVVSAVVGVSRDIADQNAVICPAVGILASTDPPRTTPAGREQAAAAERLLRGPAFEACR